MTERKTSVAGARVTINPDAKPSEAIVKAAAAPVEVVDGRGRVIVLKKPAPLANLDFAKAAGGAGLNQVYLAEVMHLKFVASIDGEQVITPGTEVELRSLYDQLGDEGNEAAQLGVFEHFMPKDATPTESALKNS